MAQSTSDSTRMAVGDAQKLDLVRFEQKLLRQHRVFVGHQLGRMNAIVGDPLAEAVDHVHVLRTTTVDAVRLATDVDVEVAVRGQCLALFGREMFDEKLMSACFSFLLNPSA